MRDLETIIDLVFLAFNFIPQSSHHSLSLIRDFGTIILTPGDSRTPIKVIISITEQIIIQNGESSEVYRSNNNGPKTLP